jgi:hypothetical protein
VRNSEATKTCEDSALGKAPTGICMSNERLLIYQTLHANAITGKKHHAAMRAAM